MKSVLTLALACILALGSTPGALESASFQDGVSAYRAGDYASAATIFRDLVPEASEPRDRALLAYDVGNALWRSDDREHALAWFSR